jgi:HSP20 family molecular chaperone IbpA
MNETESIDHAIGQVERLYRSLTGREAPPIREQPYATIPPEKIPEDHVQEQVDRLVETLTDFSGGSGTLEGWKPPISMWEGRGEIWISVDLPGITRDAVRVSVIRGMLEIHGARPSRTVTDGSLDLRYSEQMYGKFRRMIPLPSGLALDQLQAQMRSGVLEIRVPRAAGAQDVTTVHVG